MVSLCSARQGASNDIHDDLEVTWPEVNLWPWPFEVNTYVSMRIDERITMVLLVLPCLNWFKRYLRKTLFTSSAAILTFLTPVTSSLTWPEYDLSKNCRPCPSVSHSVYRLSLSCSVSEILGGATAPTSPPVGAKLARTPVGARVKMPTGRHIGTGSQIQTEVNHTQWARRERALQSIAPSVLIIQIQIPNTN